MENNTEIKEQKDIPKKLSYRKFLFAAIVVLLLLTTVSAFLVFSQGQKSDPASEMIIRQQAARAVGKDPNDLTDSDFATIRYFTLRNKELCDIKILEKFTNLKTLDIIEIHYPSNKIPKWMKILAKLGIYDLSGRNAIDLSPLKKMSNLQRLQIGRTYIKNIKPLEGLTNLEHISLNGSRISDIEPIKGLKNLQILSLFETNITDLKPIKELTNLQSLNIADTQVTDFQPLAELTNLRDLSLQRTPIIDLEPIKGMTKLLSLIITNCQVHDLEPITGLTNLQQLYLSGTPVSNLEPVKALKKMKSLNIEGCNNITDEQVEDLQKALPELKIER